MKTFLKIIRTFGFLLVLSLMIPAQVFSQNLPVPLDTDDPINTILATYTIGGAYAYTLTPATINGIVEWEVSSSDVAILNNAGLQMQLDGAPFDHNTNGLINSPDGTAEIIHIVPDPLATAVPNATGTPFELTISDNENTRVLTLAIPVVRAPVSVVMVLDRSGSMGSPPHGGLGSITRMDILKTASSLFVNKLDAFNEVGDEVALTYFASDVDNPAPSFAVALTALSSNASDFTDEIELLPNSGGTRMGPGLLAGKAKLAGVTGDQRQFIFLFTDGEQNGPDQVNNLGTEAGGVSLNNGDDSIHIVTIGTGAAAGMAAADRLQAIAEQNTPTGATARYFLLQEEVDPIGNGSDFNSATTISNFFDEAFQSMLSGSSPQTVAIEEGISDSQISTSHDFIINANINKILFELITSDQEPSFNIEKDGINVTSSNTSLKYIYGPNNGTNSLLAIIDLSKPPISGLTSEGTWSVNIRSGTGGKKPYQIKAQVDDHRLDYTFEISADDFKVEDVLQFDAALSYDNVPLEDANISAILLQPGIDLGNALAEANVDFDPSNAGDVSSVGYQKLLALIQSNPALIDSLNLQENVVSLTHSADGKYSAQYSNTNVTGVYQVIARISGSNATIGTYNRIIRRTVYLRFGDPDPDVSTQRYTLLGPDAIQLLYTPKFNVDGAQRFVGPGFASGIDITGTDLGNINTVDNGDGSYTIKIDVLNGNVDPDININLSGVLVFDGKASEFDNSDGLFDQLNDWLQDTLGISLWLFLLILLIILIIIWLIKKFSN